MSFQFSRFLFLVFTLTRLEAKEIRLTFLNSAIALEETSGLLREHGIPETCRSRFIKAVRDYYQQPLNLDPARLPPEHAGIYRFNSLAELVKALPNPLSELKGHWGLNCFDLVGLLAEDSIQFKLGPNDLNGPFFAIVTGEESISIRPTATAADAFFLAYPAWYRNLSSNYFPLIKQYDHRVCLTAVLFTSYPLPLATDEGSLSKMALTAIRSRWTRYEMRIKKLRLVLGHEVNLPGRFSVTSHCGLLLENGRRWTYLEKAGGSGPFVRLDLSDPTELKAWYASVYPRERNGYTHFLMSFDDREIFLIRGRTLERQTGTPE
jgi:hypothetical protein